MINNKNKTQDYNQIEQQMKSFLTTLLLSYQFAMAQEQEPRVKFAVCQIQEKDGEEVGLRGTMLFSQRGSGGKIRAKGVVSMDPEMWMPNNKMETKEIRYLGISENVNPDKDTC